MLVLTRRVGEKLIIGGNIEIVVCRIQGNRVVIGVDAPKELSVVRNELPRMPPEERGDK